MHEARRSDRRKGTLMKTPMWICGRRSRALASFCYRLADLPHGDPLGPHRRIGDRNAHEAARRALRAWRAYAASWSRCLRLSNSAGPSSCRRCIMAMTTTPIAKRVGWRRPRRRPRRRPGDDPTQARMLLARGGGSMLRLTHPAISIRHSVQAPRGTRGRRRHGTQSTVPRVCGECWTDRRPHAPYVTTQQQVDTCMGPVPPPAALAVRRLHGMTLRRGTRTTTPP